MFYAHRKFVTVFDSTQLQGLQKQQQQGLQQQQQPIRVLAAVADPIQH
jgi:hypothetical protein